MKNWRSLLYTFTGLYVLLGIWTPLMWLVSGMMKYYRMESFDLFAMHPFNIFLCIVLAAATLLAQLGFVLIAQDHAAAERAGGSSENR